MNEISGGGCGHLGSAIAHTAERVAAFVRSSDREAYERELEQSRPKPTPTDARTEAYHKELAAKAEAQRLEKLKADSIAMQEGKLKFVNGMRLELDHGQWWVISN